MAEENGSRVIRLAFDPNAREPFLQRLRTELQKASVDEVTIQMEQVSYVGPGALEMLQAAGETAHSAGKIIVLEGVHPGVYKALQLTNLAALFKRAHHG